MFHQKKLLSYLSRSYSYQYFYKTVNFIINIITAEWYFLFVGHFLLKTLYCVKKWNFLLIISLVIVNKSAIFCALTKTRNDLEPAETTHIIVFFYIKNKLLSGCVSLNTPPQSIFEKFGPRNWSSPNDLKFGTGKNAICLLRF